MKPTIPRNSKVKQDRSVLKRLSYVADFVRDLHKNLTEGVPEDRAGRWFSETGEGSLFFDESEAAQYAEIVERLRRDFVERDDLSVQSVAGFLREAIFHTLDLPKTRQKTPVEDRLTAELLRLHERLTAKGEPYVCFIPFRGMALDRPSLSFGRMRFVRFGQHQVNRLAKSSPKWRGSPSWTFSVSHLRKSRTWNGPCALITVTARDSAASEVLARLQTRRALDVISFFGALAPYNHGWPCLPGEAETHAQQVTPQLHPNGALLTSFSSLEPLEDFSWAKLRAEKRLFKVYQIASRLAKRDSDDGGAVLLAAAQWAGRASIERRREQKFLLYAIALESMMQPEGEFGDLTYRLKIRVAHVLERTSERRALLAEQVKYLYRVRSKIVHNGSYDVDEQDLGLLRAICTRALIRLLMTPKVHSLTRKQFGAWFEEKVLR